MDFVRSLKSKIVASTHADLRDRERRDEYVAFQKNLCHGFPAKSWCISYDSKLSLFAIGTKTGFINVYGKPEVEFSVRYKSPISRLIFLPGKGRLISLSDDQTISLWQISSFTALNSAGAIQPGLIALDECCASAKLKRISSWCGGCNDGSVMVGTESSNVYRLDVSNLNLTDCIIYQDVLIHDIPDDYKVNPGAVEALALNPLDCSKLLIGYNRGLIILWDLSNSRALNTFAEGFRVESLCWCTCNPQSVESAPSRKFLSAHNDGSYILHSLQDQSVDRMEYKPFGPFPLKPVEKILHACLQNGEELVIFTGGMPRSSFAEKFVVTIQQNPFESALSKTVCFDFTSKVIDIAIVDHSALEMKKWPAGLLILCEEELVAIDLIDADWSIWRLPYCHSLHCSPVTTSFYAPSLDQLTLQALKAEWQRLLGHKKFSKNVWPIHGGIVDSHETAEMCTDIVITGHEDGTVKLWLGHTVCMDLFYVLNSSVLFDEYVEPSNDNEDGDSWPPFRRVGSYDPFTDDPRFAVQRIFLEPVSGLLLCGGASGHVIVYNLAAVLMNFASNLPITQQDVIDVDLTEQSESSFKWKGQQKLTFVGCDKLSFASASNIQQTRLKCVLQLNPPASITALACKADWTVLVVGTAQGFALLDYATHNIILAKCLLTATEIDRGIAANEGALSRLKSFKKSLRQSFRRKRNADLTEKEKKMTCSGPMKVLDCGSASNGCQTGTSAPCRNDVVVRAVERQVEAKSDCNSLGSVIRCLYLRTTILTHGTLAVPTLWVGTNGGEVLVFHLTNSNEPQAPEQHLRHFTHCQLAKHIRLKHGAPILSLYLIDSKGFELDDRPGSPAVCASDHATRLLVVSEEQLKAFYWPRLVPSRLKTRITATEGTRIQKVQLINFQNKHDATKWEPFLVTMDNQGDVECFSSYNLKCYAKFIDCVPGGASAAIFGVLSTIFTKRGDALFLLSSSEWQRFDLNSTNTFNCVKPRCGLISSLEHQKLTSRNSTNAESELNCADEDVNMARSMEDSGNLSTTLSNNTTLDSIRDYAQIVSEEIVLPSL